MKKLILTIAVGLALTLSGCEAIFGTAATPTQQPTYTPAPTYTQLPTYTPFPSPTQPPVPTATLVPLESPTLAVFGVTPTTSQGLQATLLNFSYVREGPGTFYKPVTHVEAGETVLVLGRDHDGFWLKIRNAAGQEGWVRLTQFQGPIDVRQIEEIKEIPTASVTVTVKGGTTATPGGTVTTSVPSQATASSTGFTFNLKAGGGQQCLSIPAWYVVQAIPFSDQTKGIPLYKASDSSLDGQVVYQLDTTSAPSGISVVIQGNIFGVNCTSACTNVRFTLCASASASVASGSYSKPVVLQFGTDDNGGFNLFATSGIPTVFNVSQ